MFVYCDKFKTESAEITAQGKVSTKKKILWTEII